MAPDLRQVTREILLGFWKVHILHHAAEQPIVGQWILAELRRHGYDISPGTIYPLLQRMERNGWLRSRSDRNGGPRAPRYYTLTPLGHAVLKVVRGMLCELYEETVEPHGRRRPARARKTPAASRLAARRG